MIKNVLVHIEHIELYPVIALVIFMLVFAGALLWALNIKKSQAAAYGRMPLEDDNPCKGDHGHD